MSNELESMNRSFKKVKGKTFAQKKVTLKTYYKDGKKVEERDVEKTMNKIEIYGFDNLAELKVIIAHEIGHLVGLPHIQVEHALMNPILQKKQMFFEYLKPMAKKANQKVIEHGEFAARGSLLDLFPGGATMPYRIDFFDNTIESIKTFDPLTQRTLTEVEHIKMLGACEYPLAKSDCAKFAKKWEQQFPEYTYHKIYCRPFRIFLIYPASLQTLDSLLY